MIDSNGCPDRKIHHPNANFVSSLQKANTSSDSTQNNPWIDRYYDMLITPATHSDSDPLIPIDGGSDAGMFCVVGSPLDLTRIEQHPDMTVNTADHRQLTPGDIILSVDNYEISGYTRCDALELCHTLARSVDMASSGRSPVRIRIIPPEVLPTASTMLSSFLAAAYSVNSAEYILQEKIRENVYQRVVPCTTRLPRAEEVDGVHYHFMSVPQFLALERSGQLLESGMYKGNHYGTPRPEPNSSALDMLFPNHLSVSTSSSTQFADDSIPPPLPPLASLSTVSLTKSTPDGPIVRHPQPPKPPIRHSSINNQPKSKSSASNGSGSQVEQFSNGSESLCDDESSQSPDLGPLSSHWPHISSANDGHENYSPMIEKPLPYGWEVIRDPNYGTFYIDHIRERTQYEPPTEEDYAMGAAAAANQKHTWTDSAFHPSLPSSPMSTGQTISNGRVTPTTFVADTNKLNGPLLTVVLEKGPRGFGFTIVGGSEFDEAKYLQVRSLIPGGSAASNGRLFIGDVLIRVDSHNVLGSTHAELVDLLQSIPIGTKTHFLVCQGYRLRKDVEIMDSVSYAQQAIKSPFEINTPSTHSVVESDHVLNNTWLSNSSPTSTTVSPHSSISSPVEIRTKLNGIRSADTIQNSEINNFSPSRCASNKSRPLQRPEFLKVAICKQSNGFGFSLADHLQGQHVKAVLDPIRCGQLQVGDVLVEVNDQRVKEMRHTQVVQLLKQCPVGQEARFLVQRGGLYTSVLPPMLSYEQTEVLHPVNGGPQVIPSTHSVTNSSTQPVTFVGTSAHCTSPIYVQPSTPAHLRSMSGGVGVIDLNQLPVILPPSNQIRSRTPDSQIEKHVTNGYHSHSPNHQRANRPLVNDQRSKRMKPLDDSVLGNNKPLSVSDDLDSAAHYGSLLRSGRMPPLRTDDVLTDGQIDKLKPDRTSFMMLPGEFLVHLEAQINGFGFNVLGGAEEHSHVIIGPLIVGGAAQRSGVVRSGDKLVSINGTRVIGAKHRDVVRMLEQAAHTVNQVTLGLQRQPDMVPSETRRQMAMNSRSPVEVTVPRSQKGDGFGFFVTNTNPKSFGSRDPRSSKKMGSNDGEYIAQLVPGSKAERLGLLSVGDQIVAVNKVPVIGLHHEQVVRLIRESGDHIVLTLIRSPAPAWPQKPSMPPNGAVPVLFLVTLFRGSRGFGFSIRGGQDSHYMPLVVLRIEEGGAAHLDGRLKVGDELVEINGHPTMGMSHGRAIEIIQSGGQTMRLKVRRHPTYGGNVNVAHQRQGSYARKKSDHPLYAAISGLS